MKYKNQLLLIITSLLIAGCSGHPASGSWASDNPEDEFTRIDVTFDGRAQLYAKGSDEVARRCFWSGAAGNEIQLKCTVPENTDIEYSYRLLVTANDAGELMLANHLIGHYQRKAE